MVLDSFLQSNNSSMIKPPKDGEPPTKRIKICTSTYDDNDPELTWREDPFKLSDWDIRIITSSARPNKDNRSSTVYHVHRCVLANGEKKSGYFERLFQDNHQSHAKPTELTLDPLAADVFPALLDYLYDSSNRKPLYIRTETATALLHLGECLDIPALRAEVQEFCGQDMSWDTLGIYLEHTERFACQFVYKEIVGFLEENIRNNVAMPSSSAAFKAESAAPLWAKVAAEVCKDKFEGDMEDPERLDYLSVYLTRVLERHRDLETFHTLTAVDKMPRVDPSVALTLCELEDQLRGVGFITPLQQRCIEGLARKWNDLDSVGVTRARLLQQKPAFLVLLLDCCQKEKEPQQKPWPMATSTFSAVALVQLLEHLVGRSLAT